VVVVVLVLMVDFDKEIGLIKNEDGLLFGDCC